MLRFPTTSRQHVAEKLVRIERYDSKIIRTDVELHHERNRRQNDSRWHVELTCRTRGPVVRSEGPRRRFLPGAGLAIGEVGTAAASGG